MSRLNATLNGIVILAALFFLLSERGPVRSAVAEWQTSRRTSLAATENWDDLTATAARIGSDRAAVRVVEFIDYQCAFCRESHRLLRDIVARDASIAVAYRHYPLKVLHPRAEEAALAAICAERSGEFQVLHEYLLADDSWYEVGDWSAVGAEAGLRDPTQLVACMASDEAGTRLARDQELAVKMFVRGTPTFVFPDRVVFGASPDALLGAFER